MQHSGYCHWAWSACALFSAALLSCSHSSLQPSDAKPIHGSLGDRPIEHVVILAIDGLEHDTLLTYLERPPHKAGGFHDVLGVHAEADGVTFTNALAVSQAATVFPSYTYPAWASLFTGVFPGTHGITGNSLFFREREVARYYTEYHVDAVKVQFEKDFLSHDISDRVKTLYEYVAESGGDSLVIHHMITRGSGKGARTPDFDTLWNYQRNHSQAVDENTLWQAVKSLDEYNEGVKPGVPIKLPTVTTIYFSGLDHAEHLVDNDPEEGRLQYLEQLDELITKLMNGDRAITRHRFESPLSDSLPTDPIAWRGLRGEAVMDRTLFVLVSDHGHTATNWDTGVGNEDLKIIFNELSQKSGRKYVLETPVLLKEDAFSVVRGLFGFVQDGSVSTGANVVPVLNGGALGLYVKPQEGGWMDAPTYQEDIVPVLEHLLLTLHKNQKGPEAALYKHKSRYVYVPYRYEKSTIRLLPPVEISESPLNNPDYPMATRRLNGLASHLSTDPSSAPDIILLSDRSRQLTYHNKQDARTIEGLNVETHRHFHSDHGHLNASDSLVPIILWIGGYQGSVPLATICEASIVDVLPTILDVLGMLPSFRTTLQSYPSSVKGMSLADGMSRILTHADEAPQTKVPLCPPMLSLRPE
jgi:predicted AlkP superfamily pyrophosphatase or phosphodiesterase